MKVKLSILIYLLLVLIIMSGCGGKGNETGNNNNETGINNNESNDSGEVISTPVPDSPQPDTQIDVDAPVVCKETISIKWEQGGVEDQLFLDSGGDFDTEVVMVGNTGIEARQLGGGKALHSSDGNDIEDQYMQFRVDDNVIFEGAPTSKVQIELEYYDEGTEGFSIQYDGRSGGPAGDGRFEDSDSVDRTDSKSFKLAVFTLEDAYFANRNNGADFRIEGGGGLIIRSVTVTVQKEDSANVVDCVELLSVNWTCGEEEDSLFLDAGGDVDTEGVTVGDSNIEAMRTGGGQTLPSPDGNDISDNYMQFFIADKVIHAGNPTPLVRIELEYYDEGTEGFSIQYDARSGGPFGDGRFQDSDPVDRTDSKSLKTAVFMLEDAYFANRDNGADFRIDGGGGLIIRSVTVTLLTAASITGDDWENASITWEQGEIQGGLFLEIGGDVDTEVVTVGDTGIEARRTGNGQVLPSPDGNDFKDQYMQFGIDDNLVFEGYPTTKVQIEVEYYDEGTGSFIVQYDALSGGPFGNGSFKESEPAFKTDSGDFKTAVFTLEDANFANRDNGADFRITDWSGEALIIRSVTVTLLGEGLVPGFEDFPMTAKLSDIQGEVLFRQAGMEEFYLVQEGQVLFTSGEVLTGVNAGVFLTVSDGAVLYLGPNSIFSLEMGLYSEEMVLPRFVLLLGEMEVVSGSSGLVVYTPTDMVGAIGSQVKVLVDQLGETTLECIQGDCFSNDLPLSDLSSEDQEYLQEHKAAGSRAIDKLRSLVENRRHTTTQTTYDPDLDGVPNLIDLCPEEGSTGYGLDAQGCPLDNPFEDSDGDGVVNSRDLCPNREDEGYGIDSDGCPLPLQDWDGDGYPDHVDRCPGLTANKEFCHGVGEYWGCPCGDDDYDGIPDENECSGDDCLTDRDGDGWPDSEDFCPDIFPPPGYLSWHGCMLGDWDRDGINDGSECSYCEKPPGVTINDQSGLPDWDGDGYPDNVDRCPSLYGPPVFSEGYESYWGCPYGDDDYNGIPETHECSGGECPGDRDGDGVHDILDLCPDQFTWDGMPGCPDGDFDHDGIPDHREWCEECEPPPDVTIPGQSGSPDSGNECPDWDVDGVCNSVDVCPFRPGSAENDGCADPDSDGDGVHDRLDQCPGQVDEGYGVNPFGCPNTTPDMDGDGIEDSQDDCPAQGDLGFGFDSSGCPNPATDEDGDGIVDTLDQCPDSSDQGTGFDRYGCPEGSSDRDGDGVIDAVDKCPDEGDQGNGVLLSGCPISASDQDNDDVLDALDSCPDKGDRGYGVNSKGCPNSAPDLDFDGVPDESDKCPKQGDQGYGVNAKGCPKSASDSDGDGVIDGLDNCPDEGDQGFGINARGCPNPPPDSDGDGNPDTTDACPNEGDQGNGVDRFGCPKPPPDTDSDGDGVLDSGDSCPNEGDQGYGVYRNGCPVPPPPPETDTDGDGYTDDKDSCPNEGDQGYGVNEKGCPHPAP